MGMMDMFATLCQNHSGPQYCLSSLVPRYFMQEQNGQIHSCKFEKKQGCWKYDFTSLDHGQGASRTDVSKYVKRYNCKQ